MASEHGEYKTATVDVSKYRRPLVDLSDTVGKTRTSGGKNLATYKKHVGFYKRIKIKKIT